VLTLHDVSYTAGNGILIGSYPVTAKMTRPNVFE